MVIDYFDKQIINVKTALIESDCFEKDRSVDVHYDYLSKFAEQPTTIIISAGIRQKGDSTDFYVHQRSKNVADLLASVKPFTDSLVIVDILSVVTTGKRNAAFDCDNCGLQSYIARYEKNVLVSFKNFSDKSNTQN
jgi:hypothetical protein